MNNTVNKRVGGMGVVSFVGGMVRLHQQPTLVKHTPKKYQLHYRHP